MVENHNTLLARHVGAPLVHRVRTGHYFYSALSLTLFLGCGGGSSGSTPSTDAGSDNDSPTASDSGSPNTSPGDDGATQQTMMTSDGGGSTVSDDAGQTVIHVSDGAPPDGQWNSATANLATLSSECGNMSTLSAKPDEDLLIAGIALDGLWASRDGGGSWTALGTGSGSAMITNRTSAIVYDPKTSTRFWESGIYNGGGVYQTMNDGVTLTQLGNVAHSDLVSIDFSDANRQTLLAGGHEESQTLNRSADGGMTWTNVGGGLPGQTNCVFPLVIDSQTHLVGCAGYGGGPTGIYRTINAGGTWTNVSTSGGNDAPLVASDSSIYWASPGGNGMARSTDHGQTWASAVGNGVITGVHPVELPDGRIATVGPKYVMVSSDHGTTWSPASTALPYTDAVGIVYSSQQKAFFIWHFSCGNPPLMVPADAIMRFNFDYTKN